jgi:hypothetical protein
MRRDYGRPNLWWLLTPWRWPTHVGRLVGFWALAYGIGVICLLIFESRWLSWLLFGMSIGFAVILAIDWILFERRLRRLRREQDERHGLLLMLSNGEIAEDELSPEQAAQLARQRATALTEFLAPPKEDS